MQAVLTAVVNPFIERVSLITYEFQPSTAAGIHGCSLELEELRSLRPELSGEYIYLTVMNKKSSLQTTKASEHFVCSIEKNS
ncbi:hypothetical protein [Endozoicomonas sp. ALE010]|uniref:hypothetical protein n=1 Tax=Endozoicomonas sp. ALE010 TaxID=3403081 RepID=UPI003BB6CA95